MIPTLDPKAPGESKDYYIDWTDLLAATETIASDAWTIPGGLNEAAALTATVGNISYVGLSGGIAGLTYTVPCVMVTSGGRTLERSIKVPVQQL